MRLSRLSVLAGGLALLVACALPPVESGRRDYQSLCAGCHGDGGKGDGPSAAALARRPADLTRIAARNGGVFPRVKVMDWIDGYSRFGTHAGMVMPVFDPLMEGPLEMVPTGNGVMTPTPVRLVNLTAYVESLQAK